MSKTLKIMNGTPHAIRVVDADDNVILELPAPEKGTPLPRVSSQLEELEPLEFGGVMIPQGRTTFGEVTGLPPEQEGVVWVVSLMVAAALPDRKDLRRPDTGPDCIRKDGQPWAVRRLLPNL